MLGSSQLCVTTAPGDPTPSPRLHRDLHSHRDPLLPLKYTQTYTHSNVLRSCFWNCSRSVIAVRVSLAPHWPQEQLNQLRHNTHFYCFLPSSEYEVISKENGSFSGKNKSIQITNQTFSTVENLKPDTRGSFLFQEGSKHKPVNRCLGCQRVSLGERGVAESDWVLFSAKCLVLKKMGSSEM